MDKKQGWKASQEARKKKAEIRDLGIFVDMAGFILRWRLGDVSLDEGEDGRRKYPPDRVMVDYLNQRGWKSERGGAITHRTVQELIARIDPDLDALPSGRDERVARAVGEVVPGTEIASFHIKPEDWIEYRRQLMRGWKPSWRGKTIK